MLSPSSKDSGLGADERESDQLPLQEANPVVRFEAHATNFSIRDHVLASRSKNIGASWPFPHQLLQICLKNGIKDLLPPFDPPSSLRPAHNLVKPVPEVEQTVLLNESGEPVLKKCRLDQNLEGEEEIVSSSSTSMASDTMASKVCPVCKAFSSTSNTTLNAHMDQCLSMESEATLAVEKIPKVKIIKPRKKRFLSDIYATTTVSTLEDLDKRNGTSWAADLNPAVAMTVESQPEVVKRPKLAEPETGGDDKSEGEVYVDSNGIKIRILSQINDAQGVLSREMFRPRKKTEEERDSKIISMDTDHHEASPSKKMKLRFRNKKLRSLKMFENEVQAEVSHNEESHTEEEGSPVHLPGDQGKVLTCGSATLKNWPSSKRSDLTKKSSKKGFHKIVEHLKSAADAPSSTKTHFGKLSRFSESKTVDFPSNAAQNMENEGKSHASPRPVQRLADTCHDLLPKTKKMSSLSVSNTSIMGKHRSLLAWTDKQRSASKIQDDHGMALGALTRVSSENADANNTTMQKSLVDEERTRQVNSNDKRNAAMPTGSVEEVDEQTSDHLGNRGMESQAEVTSDQDFRACFTSHNNIRKSFSVALDHLIPNQGTNLADNDQEPSLSPTSSASTISPASDCYPEALEINHVSDASTIRESLSLALPFTVSKEGGIETNQPVERPCCCSWQTFMAGNMKQKPLSNLYIRPSVSCFYGNSNSSIAPSMESPTESILTKAFSDVGSTSPSCGTPTQSNSNSILRLMGKDVMVVNNEESSPQMPKVHSPTIQSVPSLFGYGSSHASFLNHDTFSFAVHNQSPASSSLQELNLLPGFHQSMNRETYMTKDATSNDDSGEVFAPGDTAYTSSHTMFQSPFSYIPQHPHLLPMNNGVRPSNRIDQGISFPTPHVPNPFVFLPSATHLNSPFYYPQSLR